MWPGEVVYPSYLGDTAGAWLKSQMKNMYDQVPFGENLPPSPFTPPPNTHHKDTPVFAVMWSQSSQPPHGGISVDACSGRLVCTWRVEA